MDNPFATPGTAQRYARSRPDLGRPAIERLTRLISAPVEFAIDVGCGTGHSTRALRRISRRVLGLDSAPKMVDAAVPMEGVDYHVGAAEALPVADGACELLTAGLAMHWFARRAFLSEAHRVLKPAGWLACWNAGCAGHGEPGPAAWGWFLDYQRAFPAPPRDGSALSDDEARAAGFEPALRERFVESVEFDARSFVEFLTTQSNVIAAIGDDTSRLDEVRTRLALEVAPWFDGGSSRWRFDGWIAVFRRG